MSEKLQKVVLKLIMNGKEKSNTSVFQNYISRGATFMIIGLTIILLLVLFLPFTKIVERNLEVFLFIMGIYLLDLSPLVLYWLNMISAVLDNATLASAEISPAMDEPTIKAILMGLMVSGGMLIPGNIPNIIAAGKLKITSLQYARFAFPVGLNAMVLYFIVILVTR